MDIAQVKALTAELESTLALTAELVAAVRAGGPDGARADTISALADRLAARPALSELPHLMLRAHGEINDILDGIRLTRQAIEAHTVDRIRDTKDRLNDVSATTENATLELMNGLDRSIELINSLETESTGQADGSGFTELRGQVSTLYNHLQFQDITAQQLQGVAQAMLEIESRMASVAALFDHGVLAAGSVLPSLPASSESSAHLAYNPDASMHRSRADQDMIDAAFQGARYGAPASPDAR